MHNAEDYLLSYKEQLQKASEVMKQMDMNREEIKWTYSIEEE